MDCTKEAKEFLNDLCEEHFGPIQAQIYNSFPSRFKHHGEEFIQDVQEIYAELMDKDGMPIPPKFL